MNTTETPEQLTERLNRVPLSTNQQRHEQEVETAFKEAYVYCARAYRSNLGRLNPELATAHTMESADAAWIASESRRLFCKEQK